MSEYRKGYQDALQDIDAIMTYHMGDVHGGVSVQRILKAFNEVALHIHTETIEEEDLTTPFEDVGDLLKMAFPNAKIIKGGI